MTEEVSLATHLSVAMTTSLTQTESTAGNTKTSSFERGVEFYFQCAVLVMGIVGTAANGLILYAMVASNQHTKQVLIFHQNFIDIVASFFLVITYSLKLCNIYLKGPVGYWLCALFHSDSLFFWATSASEINLATVTVERYLKVVHPVWSKKLNNWMIYSTMAIAWVVSFIYSIVGGIVYSAVIDGVCYVYMTYENEVSKVVVIVISFLLLYVIILVIFLFCYWRILTVIRRQARVMAGHSGHGSNAAQILKIQANVTKTMVLVCALFAISWLPQYISVLILSLYPYPRAWEVSYYGSALLAFSYVCTNPFIYAVKFDPVKQILVHFVLCKRNSAEQSTEMQPPMPT